MSTAATKPLPAHPANVLIGGSWQPGSGTEAIEVVNPATAEQIATVSAASPADVDGAVRAARRAFPGWSELTVEERVAALGRFHDALSSMAADICTTITAELGSPVAVTRMTQVESALGVILHDMRIARQFSYERRCAGQLIVHEPMGVIGVITPWNFPLTLATMKIAPALAAGNTVVLKPPELTPLNSWLLGQAALDAGLPSGVLNVLPGYGDPAGVALAGHPGIDLISFTGSARAGKLVAAAAAPNITKVLLELGGKSAAIILDGVDLVPSVTAAVQMAMANSGQVCAAWGRLLVPKSLSKQAVEIACAVAAQLPLGDPLDPSTVLGPVVSRRQQEKVLGYIELGKKQGATVAFGGEAAPAGLGNGFYVAPTIFTDVESSMTIAQEEIFGPVLSVLDYEDAAEAAQLANDTSYGLHGGVFAADKEQAEAMARQVRVGQVFVNGITGRSDAPFGGYKQSGYGRTGGPEGFAEVMQTKAILS
jgi:aldehyde dehydrogenase (NAD+)